MGAKEKVLAYINKHRDEFTDFLKKMVCADTRALDMGVRGNEKNGQDIIAAKLNEMKADIIDVFEPDNNEMKGNPEFVDGRDYKDRPNVVGIFKGSGGGKSLLFNGHMDTVEFGDPKSWTYGPLDPVVKDGKLYGRASCDMKAGFSAALMAIKTIRENGIILKGDILYETVVDEEGTGNGTLACCLKGYKADAAIVAEPTGLSIAPGHMGVVHYKISIKGKSSHGGAKWRGVNAIDKAMKIIYALYEAEKDWTLTRNHEYLVPQTMGVNMIHGGTRVTIVPEDCDIYLSNHFLPHKEPGYAWDGEKYDIEIREVIDRACRGDLWLENHPPKVELIQKGGACDIGKNHPICELVRKNFIDIRGSLPSTIGLVSGADTRLLVNYASTPAVTFGPGTIETAHTYDEFVPLDEYYDCIRIFSLTILDWCGHM